MTLYMTCWHVRHVQHVTRNRHLEITNTRNRNLLMLTDG